MRLGAFLPNVPKNAFNQNSTRSFSFKITIFSQKFKQFKRLIFVQKYKAEFCFENDDIFHENLPLSIVFKSSMIFMKLQLRVFLQKLNLIIKKISDSVLLRKTLCIWWTWNWVLLLRARCIFQNFTIKRFLSFKISIYPNNFKSEFFFKNWHFSHKNSRINLLWKLWYFSWKFCTEACSSKLDDFNEKSTQNLACCSSVHLIKIWH